MKSIRKKIVLTISYIAVVVPTLLVGLLAITYYYLGIEKLFSEKITASVNDTVKIATLYLNEHNDNIKTHALLAAAETTQKFYEVVNNQEAFMEFLDEKAAKFGLSEIVVFTREGLATDESLRVLGKTSMSYSLLFDRIPQDAMDEADDGMILVRTSVAGKVQALLRIDLFIKNLFIGKVYLLVGRYVDSKIMQHLEQTQEQADVFRSVSKGIKNIRKEVITAFLSLSLLFIITAIFISKKLATFILKPIHDLSRATKMFKLGKNMVKVQEKTNDDEINVLAKSFNRMIDTISSQHNSILQTKHLVEERNHFIEAIMAELSAGVIVLDKKLKIEISNISALKILGIKGDEIIIGKSYKGIIPEFSQMIKKVQELNDEILSSNMSIMRSGRSISLLVKIQLLKSYDFEPSSNAFEQNDKVIITLDDITAVVAGQRFKAWADIARRLAHEIKNPLTPIQLAVDRLEYKFLNQIAEGEDLFRKYIQTINNRVEDIKKMLADFVEFAGIATLKVQPHEIVSIVKDVIFLQKHQWTEIDYELQDDIGDCKVMCEKTYINQVMTNLLKNAAESITTAVEKSDGALKGKIKITLQKCPKKDEVIVLVEDNGIGIGADIMERICEPYVTTKATGTGLGLSIVKKIIEEHKSEFHIKNCASGGTIASFRLQMVKK